jgi:hypothetical protein
LQENQKGRYGEHQKRTEMMIVVLTAQGTSFFQLRTSLPVLGGDSQIFKRLPLTEDAGKKYSCVQLTLSYSPF